jgi:hypothetical protein
MQLDCLSKFQNTPDMSYNKDNSNTITPIGIAATGSTLFEGVVEDAKR